MSDTYITDNISYYSGLVPSEAGACDQENFVENWIGHDM